MSEGASMDTSSTQATLPKLAVQLVRLVLQPCLVVYTACAGYACTSAKGVHGPAGSRVMCGQRTTRDRHAALVRTMLHDDILST